MSGWKENVRSQWRAMKALWSSPQDAWLVRLVLGAMLMAVLGLGLGSAFLIHKAADHLHAKLQKAPAAHDDSSHDEHASAEHSESSEHGAEDSDTIKIAASPFPKEVEDAMDGQEETDKDLVDPKIEHNVGLTEAFKNDLKVERPYRFISIDEVMASTKRTPASEGMLATTVTLEVDSLEGENEVRARKSEFRSVIASLVADRTKDSLQTFDGIAELKQDIQRELNHLLGQGKVIDVLLTEYYIK